MLGYPISTQPISVLPPGLVVVTTQQSTVRFASEGFVTRATDVPASTYIPGRIANGLRLSRELLREDEGQFGALIEARFGEIVLNNADGSLDTLISDYFCDGREIRLKIGAREVVSSDRVMPRYIQTGDGASSGDASQPYELPYPETDLSPGDLFIAQISINDRGEAGSLSAIPDGWELLQESSLGPLYQAVLYRFEDFEGSSFSEEFSSEFGFGLSAVQFEWESGDSDNDVIVGRIHQFRNVDREQPWGPDVEVIQGDLDSISLPTLVTFEPNSLATYWVSWSDNVSTMGPSGQAGGDWQNLGGIISSSSADDVANRRAGAQMAAPGTISGGSIQTTPTDSPVSEASLLFGAVLRGAQTGVAGQERVQAYEDFATVYTAIAGHWSFGEETTVRLRIQTLAAKLQNRLQQLTYAGTGDSNGTADLTGRTRPLCFGHCLNVTAQLVDPSLLIFQLHSGAIEAIEAVYDQGVAVPAGSPGAEDFATYAELAGASVTSGEYATCLAEGYFKLGTAPTGTVTADVKGDNDATYVETHASIIRRMLLAYSPLVSANLDEDSFEDFDEAQPAEIGIFFPAGDQSAVEEAIGRVAFAGGAFVGQDRSGLYRVQQLAIPAQAQHWTFTDRTLIEIERLPLPYGVPWKAWTVAYERNWTVQSGGDVAAGVSQARRQFLETEARYVSETSSSIALAHATSAGAPIRQTLFLEKEDAEAEALRLLEFYALGRALYRVVVKTALFSVEIGQTVRLVYPRWNLGGGRSHVVLSIFDDADRRTTEMLIFG